MSGRGHQARPPDTVHFLSNGRSLDIGQRMFELWNNWYETLVSVEALATIIVIVVLGAGVITLVQARHR